MTNWKVGYLIGSIAKGSINRKLAKALVRLAPPEFVMKEIPIAELPLYSYDYDREYAIAASDAILFVTPEYNRSIPGALKNAIDWASRHPERSALRSASNICAAFSPSAIRRR